MMPDSTTRSISRRRFLTRAAITSLAVTGGVLADGVWIEPTRAPEITRRHLRLKRFPPTLPSLRICQLSDLHRSDVVPQAEIERAVSLTNAHHPDLILLTGDYVSFTADFAKPCAEALGHLKAPLGVYAILGNHDHWTNADVVHAALEDAEISVLRNTSTRIDCGDGAWVHLVGLDDVWEDKQDIAKALRKVPEDSFTLMMVHEPDYADTVARYPVDLQLSGHSHGGQVRIPFIGAPILPFLGRKYPMGLYQVGEMWLYTSRGIGRVSPPVRLNCRAEISIFELLPHKK